MCRSCRLRVLVRPRPLRLSGAVWGRPREFCTQAGEFSCDGGASGSESETRIRRASASTGEKSRFEVTLRRRRDSCVEIGLAARSAHIAFA